MVNNEPAGLLKHVPPLLLADLVQARWLPFVGAGFSRNAVVSTGELPLAWAALGTAFAAEVDDLGGDTSPIEALSAYEHAFSRVDLVDRTAQLIRAHDAQPGAAHVAFARVGFTEVVTTNFDFLLERAYEANGKGCQPVVDEVQLSTPNRYNGPRLVKLHGDINHPDRLIITEDDYDRFLLDYPLIATSVTAMLVDRTTVLIGYSLDDPDTRQILALIKNRLGRMRRPLWTIQVGAGKHVIGRFERRGVKVINLPNQRGKSPGDVLEQFFQEIADYWERSIAKTAESTDDRITADLRTIGEPSRICFFAVPASLYGWYRDVLFPIVERHGYVPAIARDVVSLPGTLPTKVDVLINRAALVVVELTNDGMSYEASVALSRHDAEAVLLVAATDVSPGSDYSRRQYLRRPARLESDPEGFVESFAQWLARLSHTRPDVDEGVRLVAGEPSWVGLVSAVTSLEVTLTRWYSFDDQFEGRVLSVRGMLRSAIKEGLFPSQSEADVVEEAVTRRNEVLHLNRPVSATEARAYVGAISRFVADLQARHPERFRD